MIQKYNYLLLKTFTYNFICTMTFYTTFQFNFKLLLIYVTNLFTPFYGKLVVGTVVITQNLITTMYDKIYYYNNNQLLKIIKNALF